MAGQATARSSSMFEGRVVPIFGFVIGFAKVVLDDEEKVSLNLRNVQIAQVQFVKHRHCLRLKTPKPKTDIFYRRRLAATPLTGNIRTMFHTILWEI
jgi:hypothetical protein